MKVKGITNDSGVKDYLITHDGKSYEATRSGGLFSCCGVTDTLKAIKSMIESGEISDIEMPPEASQHNPADSPGLWGCCHPCALLVLTVGDRALDNEMRVQFIRTLDSYGWLTETGAPDYRKAMREYKLNTKENQA